MLSIGEKDLEIFQLGTILDADSTMAILGDPLKVVTATNGEVPKSAIKLLQRRTVLNQGVKCAIANGAEVAAAMDLDGFTREGDVEVNQVRAVFDPELEGSLERRRICDIPIPKHQPAQTCTAGNGKHAAPLKI